VARRSSKRILSTPHNKGEGDALNLFLASADRFVETISAQAVAVAAEGEQRLLIQSTGESVVAQMRKLTDYVREAAATVAPAPRRQLEQFLRVQDGDALVERSLQVSAQMLSGGAPVTMGFFSWLDEHLWTIKKIIMEILTLIFGELPKWVDMIFQIIDEFFKLLKSLLGVRFGLPMSDVADEASRGEVNFLREMTALAALRAARTPRRLADEESS
jgi:hypothetical protein